MDDHTTYTIFWPWHTTLILTIAVSSPGARHRCQAWSRTIEAFRRRLGIWCFFGGIWATKMGSRSILMMYDEISISIYFMIFPKFQLHFQKFTTTQIHQKVSYAAILSLRDALENARLGRNWPPNFAPFEKTLRSHSVWSPTGSWKRMVPVMFLAPKDETMRFAAEIN